jgi:hypothetical protein
MYSVRFLNIACDGHRSILGVLSQARVRGKFALRQCRRFAEGLSPIGKLEKGIARRTRRTRKEWGVRSSLLQIAVICAIESSSSSSFVLRRRLFV